MIYLVIILYILGARVSVSALVLSIKYAEKTLENDAARDINYSVAKYGITIFKVFFAIFWPLMAIQIIFKPIVRKE